MSQPPSGPPPEGPEPPEPSDDTPYGPPDPAYGPPQGGWQPPAPQYGSPQYGPAPYGSPQYGQQPWSGPPGGQPPYGAPYPPPPAAGGGRSRGLLIGLAGGFMVLAVCIAVTAVLVLRDDRSGGPVPLPAGVTATTGTDGSVTMATSGVSRPLVEVYEDFQCPVCKEFHKVNDATLKNLAGQGKAKVVYHAIVIFNSEPLEGNSLRAAVAARCIDDGNRWLAFQDQLFAHQPPEGTKGFSISDLLSYGVPARLTSTTFVNCVRKQRYITEVREATTAAVSDGGVFGTPTVKVNGKALPTNETLTAEGLRNAVVAAG